MSYAPERQNLTELLSAWNSSAQTLPNKTTGSETQFNFVLNLNTVGEGDISISSNFVELGENGLYAFFAGDLRSTTAPTTSSGDLFEMHFTNSDGAYSAALQRHRVNQNDDQCYSLHTSARLQIGYALRLGGQTIAPWVRILGVLVEE